MRPVICPSILSFDPSDLKSPVAEMESAAADMVHLDIMDGQFVPPITFGAELARSLAGVTSLPIEAHLMTLTPDRHFEAFKAAGCSRITFHIEATSHAYMLCKVLHSLGLQAGVAINPGTPTDHVRPLLEVADLILVMTVNPGWGGQSLIPECLTKVEEVRKMKADMLIQVDGGVDPLTIHSLWKAGATHFVTGSYLTQASSIADGIATLRLKCV